MFGESKVILLVEGNPDDEALTLRAFAKDNIGDRIEPPPVPVTR